MNAMIEMDGAYHKYIRDPEFPRELDYLNCRYTDRSSMLYRADRMIDNFRGAKIYFKRKDFNQTDTHKIDNIID